MTSKKNVGLKPFFANVYKKSLDSLDLHVLRKGKESFPMN